MIDPAESQSNARMHEEPSRSPSASPPALPSRFRVDPILLGLAFLAGLAAAIGAVRSFSNAGAEARPIATSITAILAVLVTPFLLAWVAFRFTSRSNRAANVVFAVVLLLGFGAYASRGRAPVAEPVRPPSNSTSLAEIRAISEEARRASLAGDEDRALELTAESATKLEQVAAATTGSEKIVMEYAASLARAQNDVLKKYITAAGQYSDAGAASLVGLTDTESIDRRLSLLAAAISAHDGVIAYFRAISDRIPQELAARGVAKKDADEFLSGFVANAKVENLLAIHAAEHGMLLAARNRFDLLKTHAGKWSVNPQGDLAAAAEFPEADLVEFNRMQSEIERLADKQAVLIEERKSGG